MIELITQCPQCRHRFDVTLEQLQQRKGLLRCAQCAHIFDAYECAVAGAGAGVGVGVGVGVVEPTKPTEAAATFVSHLRPHFIGDTPPAKGVKSAPPRPTVSTRTMRSSQPITTQDPESSSHSDIRVYLDKEDTSVDSITVSPIDRKPAPYYPERERSGAGLLWSLLFVLLLVVMVAQLVYVYRAQIANSVAFTRPVLQWMCDGVGCDLPYMREIDAIEVRQSALQQQSALSVNNTYAYQLQLQLKNNLAWPQEWPTLVVSFSDAAAAGMATLAISPDEYLLPHQQGRPFEAGAQHAIRVPVAVNNKKINGFSVEKYYP